jgi:hypothetical protein
MKNLNVKLIGLSLFLIICCSLASQILFAQEGLIDTSVKISICGNEIIEGGEDCEGEDLGGETCESQGYGSGTLACDISCSFDYSGCSPAPTSTPTMTPTPTNTPTSTNTPAPTSTPTSAPTATNTPTNSPAAIEATNTPQPTLASGVRVAATSTPISTPTIAPPTPTPALPPRLRYFDSDGNGKIDLFEKVQSIGAWVNSWRRVLRKETNEMNCDLNSDGRCDLKDFSILLYYINRE